MLVSMATRLADLVGGVDDEFLDRISVEYLGVSLLPR
jgi:hypothetical protein